MHIKSFASHSVVSYVVGLANFYQTQQLLASQPSIIKIEPWSDVPKKHMQLVQS